MMFLLLACFSSPHDPRLTELGFTGLGRVLPDDGVEVGLGGWGRGTNVAAALPASPRWVAGASVGLDRPAVASDRGGVTEWWAPAGLGWEHGFTVAERPAGEGEVRFEVRFDGVDDLVVNAESAVAELDGGRVLHYAGLVAWDAERRPVPAHMEPTEGGLALVVDDAGATYPIVVDPVLAVATSLTTGGIGAFSGGGDLNNDGYDDVIAVDSTTGRINWWLGSSAGIASAASGAVSTVLPSTATLDGIGDFNGDGYDDVMAGDSTYGSGRGAVYVFLGRPGGVRPNYARRIPGIATSVGLGASVGGVGDTNGDGLADIGAWGADMTARVWQGRPTGMALATSISVETGYGISYSDEAFPGGITGLGDLNGDGYDEVGVSYPSASRYSGKVYWYYGSAAGTNATTGVGMSGTDTHVIEGWCGSSYSGSSGMGADLAALGDIDLDGYADFALSQSYEACVGYDYIGYGASGGPSTSLGAWPSFYSGGYAGTLAGGDFDGDGYGDIAGGRYNLSVSTGSATRFSGTTAYTILASTWTPYHVDTVGDVNGDGCDDLLVNIGDGGSSESLQVWEGCQSTVYEEIPDYDLPY